MTAPQNDPRIKIGTAALRPSAVGIPQGNFYLASDTGVLSTRGPVDWIDGVAASFIQRGTGKLGTGLNPPGTFVVSPVALTPTSTILLTISTPKPPGPPPVLGVLSAPIPTRIVGPIGSFLVGELDPITGLIVPDSVTEFDWIVFG
jgi:hypothetical protein